MTLQHSTSPAQRLIRDVSCGRLTRRQALKRASILGLSATALAGLSTATPIRSAAALPARQDGTPVRGGSVRVGVPGSADTFDPNLAYVFESIWPCEMMYSGLVRISPQLELEPELAVSWQPNQTADRWTFTLREGVKWHDGGDFSSEDVVATFDRIASPDFGSPFRSAIAMLERTEATSPTEVVFHLSTPYVEFAELVGNYLARIVPANRMDSLVADPNGTGPYVLEDWIPGERTVLRRFDGYFDPEGQAFLDEIQYLTIPEEATKVAALASGQIELANEFQTTSLPALDGASGVTTTEITTGTHQPVVMDVTQPPFDDARVRQAMKLCANRDGFVTVVLQGHGETAADQPVPPVDPMYGSIPIPEQNIARAQQLLAEAGYHEGLDLTLHTSPGRPGMLESALAFKDMAAPAGVRIEIQSHPIDIFWADVWKKQPFFMGNWSQRPTAEQMLSLVYLCGTTAGESNWCNREFDELIFAARAELDPDLRLAILTEAQQLVADDGPVVIPYFRSYITAHSSQLMGFLPHPLRWLDLRRAWIDG